MNKSQNSQQSITVILGSLSCLIEELRPVKKFVDQPSTIGRLLVV